ncbi:hypothetical protein NL676_012252 [Syzygium grande]|nr:hypothetical protein NL676_012252 [Syzygium grande]
MHVIEWANDHNGVYVRDLLLGQGLSVGGLLIEHQLEIPHLFVAPYWYLLMKQVVAMICEDLPAVAASTVMIENIRS